MWAILFCMEVLEEFVQVRPDDLWIYNKLQISRKLGYNCGPIGAPVPWPGEYIIRPVMNFLGMGRNARKIDLNPTDLTENYAHPGEFWCEYFTGEHISVDFVHKKPVLVVTGEKESTKSSIEESRWTIWRKIDRVVAFPPFLEQISEEYPTINVEMIGGNVIEVHLRGNPDFVWGNTVAIPVYDDEELHPPEGFTYIESPDYTRKGFYIN